MGIDASRPRVYGCIGRSMTASDVPCSTIRPAYMTAISSRPLGDDPEVVADDEQRHALLVLELREQLEDLGLHGHVERGRRLVGDEQVGVERERHRDHHTLAHAAGELVRIRVDALLGARDADVTQ